MNARFPPLSALLVLAVSLGGCASMAFLGGQPTPSLRRPAAAMGTGLHEYHVIIHCHGYLSHDSDGTVEEIAAAARRTGVDAVLMTDHYTREVVREQPHGMVDGVLFVPGVEVSLKWGGSLLATGLWHALDLGAGQKTLPDQTREQGGFAVVGHVEQMANKAKLGRYQGFEFMNLHARFMQAPKAPMILAGLLFPPDSFLEIEIANPKANLERYDRELAKGHHLVPVAGSDAHANIQLFGPLGGTVGTYAEVFRLYSNRVLAPRLTEPDILDALKKGRVYTVFDYLAPCSRFVYRYVLPGQKEQDAAILGATATYRAGGVLQIRLPRRAEIRVLKDGKTWKKKTAVSLDLSPPDPGIYRVEVYLEGRLWILPAPIYLTRT